MTPQDIPLRDLHLPAMTDWWPLAPGWWVLLAAAAVLLLLLLRRAWRHWQGQAARRRALRQLGVIKADYEKGVDPVVLGKELSELVRRAMLAYAPRREVAGLTGDRWLGWLDRGLDKRPFTEGGGRILESLPYMDPERIDADTEIDTLIAAVRLRLSTPLAKDAA